MKVSSACSGFLSSFIFGLVFCLMGGLLVGLGLKVIHFDGSSSQPPQPMAAAAGAVFFFAGLMVILRAGISAAGVETALGTWLQYLIFLGMMAVFSIVFIWAGFGSAEGSDRSGGIFFGLVGLAMALGTAAYAYFKFPLRRV